MVLSSGGGEASPQNSLASPPKTVFCVADMPDVTLNAIVHHYKSVKKRRVAL